MDLYAGEVPLGPGRPVTGWVLFSRGGAVWFLPVDFRFNVDAFRGLAFVTSAAFSLIAQFAEHLAVFFYV